MQDPRPGKFLVWRGTRSPVGGPGSLFVDRNVEGELPEPASPGSTETPTAESGLGTEKRPLDAAAIMGVKKAEDSAAELPPWLLEMEELYLTDLAVPMARDVLYLGFRF